VRIPVLLVLVLALGCSDGGIEWQDPQPATPELVARYHLDSAVTANVPAAANQCTASVRVARSGSDEYATWWALRPDSTADLVVATRRNGAEWGSPVRVDTTDVARVGCRRAPPAITADGPDVHVAYSMTAREGPGIFASHAMDHGLMFHSPVAVVYGEQIGLTSVAARGNDVVVAYEDPNSTPQRVGLALSRTQGHTFETREIVSPGTGIASAPAVTISDSLIAVAWSQGQQMPASGATLRMLRLGVIR